MGAELVTLWVEPYVCEECEEPFVDGVECVCRHKFCHPCYPKHRRVCDRVERSAAVPYPLLTQNPIR